jgi:hypothetical protein
MLKSLFLRLSAVVLLFFFSNLSQAAFVVTTSLADFTAATRALGVDSYNDLDFNGYLSSPVDRQAGATSYTATATTGKLYVAGSAANSWLSTDIATDAITFSGLTKGAQAIGGNFFGTEIKGLFAGGTIRLTATDQTGTTVHTIAGATLDSFVGFVSSNVLRSLTVSSVSPDTAPLWPTVDHLTIGLRASNVSPVPEPDSLTLLLSGLGFLGLVVRRRRN